jgi:hypothetical protein
MYGPLSLIWLSASSIAFAPFTALYPRPPWPCTPSTALYPLYGTLSALWPSVSSTTSCPLYGPLPPLCPFALSMTLCPLYGPMISPLPFIPSTALCPLYCPLHPVLPSLLCGPRPPLCPSAPSAALDLSTALYPSITSIPSMALFTHYGLCLLYDESFFLIFS